MYKTSTVLKINHPLQKLGQKNFCAVFLAENRKRIRFPPFLFVTCRYIVGVSDVIMSLQKEQDLTGSFGEMG